MSSLVTSKEQTIPRSIHHFFLPPSIAAIYGRATEFLHPTEIPATFAKRSEIARICTFIQGFDWSKIEPGTLFDAKRTEVPYEFYYLGKDFFSIDISSCFVSGSSCQVRRAVLWHRDKTSESAERLIKAEVKLTSEAKRACAVNKAEMIEKLNSLTDRFPATCDIIPHISDRLDFLQEAFDGDFFDLFKADFRIEKYNVTFTKQQKITLLRDIASDIDFLHSHGIIHRDIKTENCLYSLTFANGKRTDKIQGVLTDFDIAQTVDANSKFFAKDVRGTPWHLAPEMYDLHKNNAQANPLTGAQMFPVDVWAFGMMFYEMLKPNIQLPWVEKIKCLDRISLSTPLTETDFDVLMDAFKEGPKVNDQDSLTLLCAQMLSYDASQRPSINEVFEILQAEIFFK